MSARRPADIARQVRLSAEVAATNHGDGITADALDACADELDALDGRWPTADEIAELRALCSAVLLDGRDRRIVERVLDKLDPPELQADDPIEGGCAPRASTHHDEAKAHAEALRADAAVARLDVARRMRAAADFLDRLADDVDGAARAALDARRQS